MPPRTEQQLERDIAEVEECQHGLQTQSILNPGGQAIPPLTWASHKELLTASLLPLPTSLLLTEIPEEHPEIRRTSTPLSITSGLEEIRFEEELQPTTLKKPKPYTLHTSLISAEEADPFQPLLCALKNSPRLTRQPQLEEMSEDKKPSGSRPKVEQVAEEAIISATVLVQVVATEKEVKAALPRAFTGHRKDAKKFL
uniref:Reverse transcriptase-rnase h-integrase n=1 Tax=Moniliophthora roreri TaxID=221103 RepID=A0A0W0FTL6_MONRR